MHNVFSESIDSSQASSPQPWKPMLRNAHPLFRPVFAPAAGLVIAAVLWFAAAFLITGGHLTLTAAGALQWGIAFGAIAVGGLGMVLVFRSGGFDLSAGAIMILAATIVAWGIREDVAVICAYGDNLEGARSKFRQNQDEIAARKATTGWPTLAEFYHDVARNSRYLERLQYIQKNGASFSPLSPGLAVVLAMGAALALGSLNGVMIHRLRIAPLYATLGTTVLAMSSVHYLSTQEGALFPLSAEQVPYWLGLPQPGHVCLAAGIAVVIGLMLRFGSPKAAAGAEPADPDHATISPVWKMVSIYSLAGLLAGIAGALMFPQLIVGNGGGEMGWELRFLSAACIGGALLGMRRGIFWGTLMGAALVALVDIGGGPSGVMSLLRDLVLVALLVGVVACDRPALIQPQASPQG
jgi:ribose/xylose/arabinose/galactoside ABC-type transport system permease subunit